MIQANKRGNVVSSLSLPSKNSLPQNLPSLNLTGGSRKEREGKRESKKEAPKLFVLIPHFEFVSSPRQEPDSSARGKVFLFKANSVKRGKGEKKACRKAGGERGMNIPKREREKKGREYQRKE